MATGISEHAARKSIVLYNGAWLDAEASFFYVLNKVIVSTISPKRNPKTQAQSKIQKYSHYLGFNTKVKCLHDIFIAIPYTL
jgi:hypothetical protein